MQCLVSPVLCCTYLRPGSDISCPASRILHLASSASQLVFYALLLISRFSYLAPCVSYLMFRVLPLASRILHLASSASQLVFYALLLISRFSYLATCVSYLMFRVVHLASCNLHLASSASWLASCVSNLISNDSCFKLRFSNFALRHS